MFIIRFNLLNYKYYLKTYPWLFFQEFKWLIVKATTFGLKQKQKQKTKKNCFKWGAIVKTFGIFEEVAFQMIFIKKKQCRSQVKNYFQKNVVFYKQLLLLTNSCPGYLSFYCYRSITENCSEQKVLLKSK